MQNIPSWSWSYGSWIYNYLSIQCLSPLKLWVQIPSWRGVLDTTLRNKVCRWLATGQSFFSRYSGFLHQYNWRSWYTGNWNIVESGVEHHKPTTQQNMQDFTLLHFNSCIWHSNLYIKNTRKWGLYEQLPFIYRLKLYALFINVKKWLSFIDSDLLYGGSL